jgi:hypothetical protein
VQAGRAAAAAGGGASGLPRLLGRRRPGHLLTAALRCSLGPRPQEERASFGERLLGSLGLVDSFRAQHPEAAAYTYWTYRFNCRASNKGWRLDYFLVGCGAPGSAARVPSRSAGRRARVLLVLAPSPASWRGAQPPARAVALLLPARRRPAGRCAAALRSGPQVSSGMAQQVHDSYTLPDVMGSDHCPIGVIIKH